MQDKIDPSDRAIKPHLIRPARRQLIENVVEGIYDYYCMEIGDSYPDWLAHAMDALGRFHMALLEGDRVAMGGARIEFEDAVLANGDLSSLEAMALLGDAYSWHPAEWPRIVKRLGKLSARRFRQR